MTVTHYSINNDWWTVCGLWTDAVTSTPKRAKVTCPKCIAKSEELYEPSD